MLSFEELARRVVIRTGNRLDIVRAKTCLRNTLNELWQSHQWSCRFAESVLATDAPKSTGTLASTATTTVLQGTGTAFATGDIGKKLRVANEHAYYTIEAVDASVQQLRLATAYVGGPLSGAVYQVFKSIYTLPADVDHIVSMAHWFKLGEAFIPGTDRVDGRRSLDASHPEVFVYRGEDALGQVLIELWPVPAGAIGIPYVYVKRLPTWTDALVV